MVAFVRGGSNNIFFHFEKHTPIHILTSSHQSTLAHQAIIYSTRLHTAQALKAQSPRTPTTPCIQTHTTHHAPHTTHLSPPHPTHPTTTQHPTPSPSPPSPCRQPPSPSSRFPHPRSPSPPARPRDAKPPSSESASSTSARQHREVATRSGRARCCKRATTSNSATWAAGAGDARNCFAGGWSRRRGRLRGAAARRTMRRVGRTVTSSFAGACERESECVREFGAFANYQIAGYLELSMGNFNRSGVGIENMVYKKKRQAGLAIQSAMQ